MADRINGASAASAEFRVGQVLDQAFGIIRARPAPFLVMAVVGVVATAVIGFIAAAVSPATLTSGITTLGQAVVSFLVQSALVYAAIQEMQGEPFTIAESFAKTGPRLASLIGAALLSGLVLFVMSVLLVIPGIIAYCALYVVAPVCIVEGLGSVESLRRSARLTKGFRWKIFAIALLPLIVLIIAVLASQVITMATSSIWVGVIFALVIELLFYAFTAILVAVVYTRLRIIKEGLTLHSIASVFD